MLSGIENNKKMNEELSSSKEDLERQLNQTIEQWQLLYEIDRADCDFVREEFWQEIQHPEAATQILLDIEEVFKERHHNLQTYRAKIAAFIEQFHHLDTDIFAVQLAQKRSDLQAALGLSDRRTDPHTIVKRHRKNLEHYTQAVLTLAKEKQSFGFHETDRAQLEKNQQTLSPTVAQQIEQSLIDQKRQEYHKKLLDHIAKAKQLPDSDFQKTLLKEHWLEEHLVQEIHQTIQIPAFTKTQIELPKKGNGTSPLPPRFFQRNRKLVFGIAGISVAVAAIAVFPSLQKPQPLQTIGNLSITSELAKQTLQEAKWVDLAKQTIEQSPSNGEKLVAALKPLQTILTQSPYQEDVKKLTSEICVKLQAVVKGDFDKGNMSKVENEIVDKAQPTCTQLKINWETMKTSWNTREDYLIKAKQLLRQGSLQEAITEARKVLTPDRNPKIPVDQKFISQIQIQRANAIIHEAQARLAPPQTSNPPINSTEMDPGYQDPYSGGGSTSGGGSGVVPQIPSHEGEKRPL